VARKKQKKTQRRTSSPVSRDVQQARKRDAEDQPSVQDVVKDLLSNRPGFVGFLLSVLQLLGHTAWIMLVWYLSAAGKVARLDSDSPMSWLIVGLLGISLTLTFVSLFVCLFFGLRRSPRVLAVAGFVLSFFVGVLASAVVFMQGLRAMSGP
jgi:hypothetical protein